MLHILGYSNELGESFRPLIKKSYVHATYGVAIAYVFADTFDKASKSFKKDQSVVKAAKIGGDVVLWQILASVSLQFLFQWNLLIKILFQVAIPGFTINRICWGVQKAQKLAKFKHPIAKWVPTVVGLLSIPFIIHPIDSAVDVLMDETYRKYVL